MLTPRLMSIESASAAERGYRWCLGLAKSHYENFPVASLLLPAQLRKPVAAIYAFARTADDIADAGEIPRELRLRRLNEVTSALDASISGETSNSLLFQALADTIHRYGLPVTLFHDLLSAFRQDVNKTRYADFAEVMDYCRRSANPIGRLILHIVGPVSQHRLTLSDAVCSALQLINFLQDIDEDFSRNNRIYLPLDEMQRFGVRETHIAQRCTSAGFERLIHFQIQRADEMLRAGSPLGSQISGRLGLELRAIILGGLRMAEKLRRREDPFERPTLTSLDRTRIIWCAFKQSGRFI